MSEEKMMCMATISTSDSPSNIYIQILDQQFKKFHILENEMNIVLNNAAIKLESSQIQIGKKNICLHFFLEIIFFLFK
jgi:hypothetical protein